MDETISKSGSEIKSESRCGFQMRKAMAQRDQFNPEYVILPRIGQAINKQITHFKKS